MGFLANLFGRKLDALQLAPGRGWIVDVVGKSFYQPAIERHYRKHGGTVHDLKVSVTLRPNGPRDKYPDAVTVRLDGNVAGHLPVAKAAEYRTALGARTATCSAKIVGGYPVETANGGIEFGMFGIKLNCAWPPREASAPRQH